MGKCNFCSEDIDPGTGKTYIYNDGKTVQFCSRTCEKMRIKLKKNPAKLKWCNPDKKKKK